MLWELNSIYQQT